MASPPKSSSRRWSPHPYAILLVGVLVACMLISVFAGSPDSLPTIALGSTVLLHLERTVAFFAGALLLVVILTEAWRGNLPIEISGRGLKYERFKQETRDGLEALSEAIAEERQERESST